MAAFQAAAKGDGVLVFEAGEYEPVCRLAGAGSAGGAPFVQKSA